MTGNPFDKGSGAPDSPDFKAAAERQAQSGRLNTDFASWDGQNLNLKGGLGQGAGNLMGQIGSQGALPTGAEAREQAINSAYGSAASRLDPQFAQRETSLRSRLANQGLDPGSEAADNAMGNFGRERTDAYGQAMANAIGQGTSAGNAIFQQGLQGQMAPYQQLGSLAGLLGANQGRETQYLNAANMGYQGDLNKYGADQADKNSMLSGLMSMGGTLGAASLMAPVAPAALAASDERLKKNVERSTLDAYPGVPFASWEWIKGPPGRFVGVIAQDMERVKPEWVHTGPDGMKMVDYTWLSTGGTR